MNRKCTIILIVLLALLLSGCSNESKPVDNTPLNVEEEVKTPDNEDVDQIDENSKVITTELEQGKAFSKLDGNTYDEKLVNNRPIMVSIDNHPNARWQAGLAQAEIVYEIEAEFPYTRYLAIFQTQKPELIGPIRSARPYMLYLALEYSSIFVHVGGSEQALSEIKTLKLNDIDGLYTSSMWRYYDTNKYAPHNMYSTIDSIREDASNRKYSLDNNCDGYKFYASDKKLSDEFEDTTLANYVSLAYNRENSTEYVYDPEKLIYNRIKDGANHIDENNNNQITAKNILVYEVDREVLDNDGRLYLGVIGSGNGYYITNGEKIDITWEKSDEYTKTKFYHGDSEISLNKGNTWIQVVTKNATKVEFNK